MIKTCVFFFVIILPISNLVYARSIEEFRPSASCPQLIENKYYIVCYSVKHRVAKYTAHWLSLETMAPNQSRTNDYRVDSRVNNPVGARDYAGSGFDRGHLVPAADMKMSKLAMSESFFMTNMTPQRPGFNRGIWQSLERSLRKMISQRGEAYVVTAPLLDPGLPQLLKNISIPENYYKVAYFPQTQQMVGYLIPNFSQSGRKLSEFLTSVDEIEALSGIDFFSQLPDELENQLEAGL